MDDDALRQWEHDLRVSLGQTDWREGKVPSDGRRKTTRYSALHRQWGRPYAITDVDAVWTDTRDWFHGEGRYWFLFDQMRTRALVIEHTQYEALSDRGDTWMVQWARDAGLPAFMLRPIAGGWDVRPASTPRLFAFQSLKRGGDKPRLADRVVQSTALLHGLQYVEKAQAPLGFEGASEWFSETFEDPS